LNIRKFTGATSRDALRLVREALGADAVVLSNRSLPDGTVEIVALADSDFASIAPAPAVNQNAAAEAAPRSAPAAGFSNPYANGLPDVFSSVFGASPEAGADDEPAVSALPAPATLAAEESRIAERTEPSMTAAKPAMAAPAARPAERPAVAPLAARPAEQPATPRTLVESNPWLIDHAREIAGKQQAAAQQAAAHSAKPMLTPATAKAKGLGLATEAPAPTAAQAAPISVETPDWAREAAQLAARRASQRAPAQGGLSDQATAAITDAINTRMSQIVNETVMNELASMRGMMEEHFAGLLWADGQRRSPLQSTLTRHLFAAGFSAQLVRMIVDNLPAVDNFEAGMEWVTSVLESNLPVMENEDALMERGGVFALMGPTGVGKTTTTAKLAARCVMRFGASKVALLTTDSYRIGGHEQLRIFGKILGVSVHAVKDGADLQLALSELRNKHIVLIDTIGMSQRDRLVSDQIAMLSRAGQPVQRLLLLNATSHGDTLNEVVQAYQSDKQPLAGCILTKLDEATNLGSTLDTVLRYRLPVHYVSTGQKVPENLYVATRKFLIRSAFCIPRDHSPFVPQDDDIPGLLSALSARSTAEQHEVRFG
jgi:flagellar biosynthesis protein FlhF